MITSPLPPCFCLDKPEDSAAYWAKHSEKKPADSPARLTRQPDRKPAARQRLGIDEDRKFAVTEAYRKARTNLTFSILKEGCRKIVFTSANAAEGKTTTTANVAISLAQQVGVKVLLIDGDLRKPKLNRFFGLKNIPGLTNYLVQSLPREEIIQSTRIPNLQLISSGTTIPNPSEILASPEMQKFLATLGAEYDFIILDSPPINAVIDAVSLSSLADGYVLVVRSGVTQTNELDRAILALEKAQTKILGLILNDTPLDTKKSHYYNYYSSDETHQ
ncbi:MAG: CpsD/CapB family tyrosine-protein kinase [Oscillospiraceae bacterium]|nr:CpsD/CapB family tyrosine-protein kinase [Oscillospiraceae bacterium]MDD4367623.1 CpsD/CapB family tyrosine-protein kinase [Oscillospiraceae bacterium]